MLIAVLFILGGWAWSLNLDAVAAAPGAQADETATVTPAASPTISQMPLINSCNCGLDAFEPNNELSAASPLSVGAEPQPQTFHVAADVDWFSFDDLRPGRTYRVSTSELAGGIDTYMILYDKVGNPIRAHDDIDRALCLVDVSYCASSINWTATSSGPYYLFVRTLDFFECDCPSYRIGAVEIARYLPVVLWEPSPTPTPTPTVTNTPTSTPTPTASATPTATPTPTATETSTPTATPTDGPSPTPTMTPADPPIDSPQAVAVDSTRHLVYVASRDNDRIYMIDGITQAVLRSEVVPDEPWGVAFYGPLNKVYVASWTTGTVTVLNATTLATIKTIPVGPNPTWVEAGGNRIRVIAYGINSLVVIDPATDTVVRTHALGRTTGAWGIAYNPNLGLTYVTSRDSKTITVVDANFEERTIVPAGRSTTCEPFEADFNAALNRLYTVCDVEGQLNDRVIVHQPDEDGLVAVAEIIVGSAGPDTPVGENGRGGVVANPLTGSVFVSNAYDDTVSVIDGTIEKVIDTVAVGDNPFGLSVDTGTQRVFVTNRSSDNLSVFSDPK